MKIRAHKGKLPVGNKIYSLVPTFKLTLGLLTLELCKSPLIRKINNISYLFNFGNKLKFCLPRFLATTRHIRFFLYLVGWFVRRTRGDVNALSCVNYFFYKTPGRNIHTATKGGFFLSRLSRKDPKMLSSIVAKRVSCPINNYFACVCWNLTSDATDSWLRSSKNIRVKC